MKRTRLDLHLFELGMAESRTKAQALIMAGQVLVDGQVERRASFLVSPEVQLKLVSTPPFVSRGGNKLNAALEFFPVIVTGRVCADVGSSTGGFTDCLLKHGAAKVFAIDVGKGLLDWKLRTDSRVVVLEETNARYLKRLPEPVSLVVIDASFISLKILLPVIKNWFSPSIPSAMSQSPLEPTLAGRENGDIVILIKPQFEAGRRLSARNKGVIRNHNDHRAILLDVLTFAQKQDLNLHGMIRSPLVGPKGNIEFLAWLKVGEPGISIQDKIKDLFGITGEGE